MALFSTLSFKCSVYSDIVNLAVIPVPMRFSELLLFYIFLDGQKHKMRLCTVSFWYSAKLVIWSEKKI